MKKITTAFGIIILSISIFGCSGDVFDKYKTNRAIHDLTPDITSPDVYSVRATSHTTVEVVFSEELDEYSANSASNYHIQSTTAGSINVVGANIESDKKTVILTVEEGMVHGSTYTLLVQNVADSNGNAIANATKEFTGRGKVVADLSNTPSTPTNEQSIDITVGGTDIVSYQYNLLRNYSI